MSILNNHIEQFSCSFTRERNNEVCTLLFVKGLIVVALFRFFRMWMVSDILFTYHHASPPGSLIGKIILLPAYLTQHNVDLFILGGIFFLVLALILKPDYRINMLFFWLMLSYFKIKYPVVNGADYSLLVFSMLAVPLSIKPVWKNQYFETVAISLFNAFRIMVQIQVVLIYLISGWDKLKNPLWRSGEAFEYIARLESMFNPFFSGMVSEPTMQFVWSWLTIAFELLFIPLVFVERTRLIILLTGVLFHVVIWLMLGLPDFAWMMITSYLIFLKDKDFIQLRNRFKPQLP